MRFRWAGLFLLFLSSAAWGQATGQVLSIGFNDHYRPDAWTPMLVQLSSQSDSATVYQIQVVQQDLDRDQVHYIKMETLGGNIEGKPATTENFWVYFRPQPTDGGLPDSATGHNTADLARSLKVFLCDQKGKQICVLPLTNSAFSEDLGKSGGQGRGRRMVLFVSDGTDKPVAPDFSQQRGILEEVDPIQVKPTELPDNVIGYEGVDAIVWMDADAGFLTSGTHTPSLEALGQWVKQGGHLVICEPSEPNKIKPFARMDLLPVGTMIGGAWAIPMADRTDLTTLRRLAKVDVAGAIPWPQKLGTFKVARVPALAGAKVDEWIAWQNGDQTTYTPWLARRGVGLGAVTWVAQDLGNPSLTTSARGGWRYVWERIFGWNDDPNVPEVYTPPTDHADPWETGAPLDIGRGLFDNQMVLHNTAVKLEAIAILFFVIYGLAAGPGSYFLLAKKREHLSWFYFGLMALIGTGLTVVLVKLVVRGPPQIAHWSIVRAAAGETNGVIDTRFGLYIPQDGPETIAIKKTAEHEMSYIAPFPAHPDWVDEQSNVSSYEDYNLPVRDPTDFDSPAITIPYRSSSKKLQAHWVGEIANRIDESNKVKLVPPGDRGYISGLLANHTGYDLVDVYLAFQQSAVEQENAESVPDDMMLVYVPGWKKDSILDLSSLMGRGNLYRPNSTSLPGGKDPLYGLVRSGFEWDTHWQLIGDGTNLLAGLPMLAIFDRVPPWKKLDSNKMDQRKDLFRRSGRLLDLSPAIEAGSLAVVAVADVNDDTEKTPLPIPMTVNDVPVDGPGMTIFQFVLPLDRGGEDNPPKPATQPSTGPS